MKVYSIITQTSEFALASQNSDGSMPAGHNGPYKDPETPVRNTSHWLVAFLKSWEITTDQKFRVAAEKCLGYLLSGAARPMGASFWHRSNPKKDFTNGVMGQAWTLEALEYAFRFFGDDQILRLAEEVYKLHPYDADHKAWKIVNVDGSIRGFDVTFNHQLWYAAIGSRLATHGDLDIKCQAQDFISAIKNNIKMYPDGVIMHLPTMYLRTTMKKKLGGVVSKIRTTKNQSNAIYMKSVGYHGFNLYALGIIKEQYPELEFFLSKEFQKMIEVIRTDRFKNQLDNSTYSYDYNPPGFELGFAQQKFDSENFDEYFLKKDIMKSFDQDAEAWGIKNKFDPATASARVYEACQLENVAISIDVP
ncbi:hypothetical protein SAMN04489724_0586 [Algoriphagus locisalis]|uniref:Agl cluster protein AglQ n=1 Tax=Algoriphagus locisalis TaxID=305507 RepID=A0A1I6XPK5_9BACT|nr:hypothetical protein [Algoriphagus locisalis]SFT39851.1 hypothetical protein SAMN04489724_0586 [Algoriphagus locisalis]